MNCGMKDDMLLAWVDGDLDQAGRARVAEHIVGCVDCHRTIGDLKDVTGALEKWCVPEPASTPTARELLDRGGLPPSSAAPGSGGWRDLVRRYGAVAGIVLFAAVAGLVVLPRYTPSERTSVTAPIQGETAATSPASPAGAGAENRQSFDDAGSPTDVQADGTVTAADAAGETPPEPGVAEEQDADKVQTEAGDSAAGPPPADGFVGGAVGDTAAAAEKPASDEPAPPPGATAQPPAAAPVATEAQPGRDNAKAGKQDAAAGASGVAPAAPKSLARSAGRRESEAAVVHRADVSISATEASAVADRVASAARAEGGSVTKRWTRSKDADSETVTVELSVPAAAFERTISRLRSTGNVQSVRRSAIDLSGRLSEIDDELAEERKNEDARADARKRKSSKESLERERRSLAARADRAIITVTIVAKP